MSYSGPHIPRSTQRGATAVEFAIVSIVLLGLLITTLEFGRALFTWNSAIDATRRGARTAAIVAVDNDEAVYRSMCIAIGENGRCELMPGLERANVIVEYSMDGIAFAGTCTPGSCNFVRVSIAGYVHRFALALPIFPPGWVTTTRDGEVTEGITLPSFSTTLPVEALGAG